MMKRSTGKVSITLHETGGVAISSPGNVAIQGGNFKLEVGKGLSLKAETALYLKGGASSMVLDGETDLKAPVIEQEGTVKAPVFVTDLPPVWEPEIVSVEAYEASQSSAASHTGSGNAPTAKITSPAAEAAANNMLATESKLAGSIPVMTGVLLSALGGPANKAVGVALQAAAGVPLRSDGKAKKSASNSLHPLKQLAGLLLQGLIDQQIYEEERQAYYTKWILGKMLTSARQVLYSDGPLDFVRNVLKESEDMYQSYQQVPEDMRSRWVDQHASSIELTTVEKYRDYDFSKYQKTLMGSTWVLSEKGRTDREAARLSLIYTELVREGVIKPSGNSLDNNDPITEYVREQTKLAREGYNMRGEKLTQAQKVAIIYSGLLYEYYNLGISFRGNRNIGIVPNGFSDPKYKKKGETSTSSNNPNKSPEIKRTVNIPTWKGSGPTSGVLGVNSLSPSVKAIKNYYPKKGGIEFIFDPETSTFVVGKPKDEKFVGSPHQRLVQTINADEKNVVGGTFTRGENGEIYTTENSGHYGQNWTTEVRNQFTEVMKNYGLPVEHELWGM
ncbi:polymorphic toxin type 43 domain-containing protein [Paenibacillus lentus]|uniref:polymorphic toxin type 43 domain-containing protein n=1 Tax=Paenibacillus lentus TaxID=1338368 RepID=UPI001FE53F8F|nr:polymorphic toxin type 43 domain-containing protein [Paenibacillus lentus]